MTILFVETTWFTKRLKSRLDDREYRAFQRDLAERPQCGAVMPGCGGLRKVRWGEAGRGKGKRGGFRIIYLWIPEAFRIDLIDIYGKDDKEDLSASEKADLARLVQDIRREAIEAFRRSELHNERP